MLSDESISFPTKQFTDPVLLIVSDLHFFFAYLPCLLYEREVFKIEMIVPPPCIHWKSNFKCLGALHHATNSIDTLLLTLQSKPAVNFDLNSHKTGRKNSHLRYFRLFLPRILGHQFLFMTTKVITIEFLPFSAY